MRTLLALTACLVLSALTSGGPGPTHAEEGFLVTLPGHVLPALDDAVRIADGGGEPIMLTLVLARDDEEGFQAHLRGLRDPSAPSYRHFLSQEEVAERFGPSAAAYDAVLDHLRAQGFTLVAGSPVNRLTLSVRGTRAAAERAFHVAIDDYRLGRAVFYANAGEPRLPAAIARHVRAVTGMASLATPRPSKRSLRRGFFRLACHVLLAPVHPSPSLKLCSNGRVTPYKQCLSAADSASANDAEFEMDWNPQFHDYFDYVPIGSPCPAGTTAYAGAAPGPETRTRRGARGPAPPPLLGGSGQTIGIIGFDTFAVSDVADYLVLMGLPATDLDRLTQVRVLGGASPGADQDEMLLDTTTVMTLAPGADVRVYDAPFRGPGVSFQPLFNAAINDGVDVISNSWAYCEDQTTLADAESIDAIFQNAALSGISIFNAAGDNGSTCLNGSANTAHVPATSPNATAVGGSTVMSDASQQYAGETWWDGSGDTPPTGQGGFGVSQFFARPAYQDGHHASPMRSVPDVVANADPARGVMICQASTGGCPTGALYGGTSIAAPIWAAYTALINEALGVNLGFANPWLYTVAGTDAFRDAASMGTDFAHVGLGSPSVDRLILRLGAGALGLPDAGLSLVSRSFTTEVVTLQGLPAEVPADGVGAARIVVTLLDGNRHAVPGKTVALSADPPGNVVIDPASAATNAQGEASFTLSNLVAEDVTVTATDTTDAIVLDQTPTVRFVAPPAVAGSIAALPTTVTADGLATATIMVTLEDALARGTPGKLVHLVQGDGHSIVSGPTPSVTDVNGEIVFTATNVGNETVTYTAIDVTDGNLPVPGDAQVTFESGAGTICGSSALPPVGMNGYTVTPFATGFVTGSLFFGNISFGSCVGASTPAFPNGTVVIPNFRDGDLFAFGPSGGAAASPLANHGPTLGGPVVGADGRLYATRTATTGDFDTGAILELDRETGAFVRTVVANVRCPNGLVVDPLSGDLFFDDFCFGAGSDDPRIHRVRNPGSATPTVEVYATLPARPNGAMSFAPDGTLFVVVGYTNADKPVMRVSGTDQPGPPTIEQVADLESAFWVNVAGVGPGGAAESLLVLTSAGLELVDITVTPPTRTVVAQGIGGGKIGPDGCLYAPLADGVFTLTDPGGGCSFFPGTAQPSLELTPTTVAPDPAQGTARTFTVTFHNTNAPAGTPVFFQVAGANPMLQMIRTDAGGAAEFSHTGVMTGADTVVATASLGGPTLTSNEAHVTWEAGKHVTFLTLNPSPTAGLVDEPVDVVASLTDTSEDPPVPVEGATIDFTLNGAQCAGVTNASGLATCQLTPGAGGSKTLTAFFAGTPSLLSSNAAVGFTVVGGAALGHFVVYKAKPTRKTPKVPKFGPVVLEDAFGASSYVVRKQTELVLPANKNDEGFTDSVTHLTAYAVKQARGSARRPRWKDIRVANQCGELVVTVKKPVALLVPTAKDLNGPIAAPDEPTHNVDHFLCYDVKDQKKLTDKTPVAPFPKGVQVEAVDQFQSRRYDLKKPEWLCNPVAQSGNPVLLAGKEKGAPFPIAPAAVRNPESRLLCYKAKVARKEIDQAGCEPAQPKHRGVTIAPRQPRHTKRLGIHIANQFGAFQVDSQKATMVCIPTLVPAP